MLALDSSVSGVEDAASFSPAGCFVLLGFGKEAIFDQDMIRVRAHAQAKVSALPICTCAHGLSPATPTV